MRVLIAAFFAGATAAAAAGEDIQPTYQATFDLVAARPECAKSDHPDFTMFFCDKPDGPVMWYFTKPNNPANPGVIKRYFEYEKGGGTSVVENARSYGSDEAQPAFKAWLDQFRALDEQMKAYVKAHSGEQQ